MTDLRTEFNLACPNCGQADTLHIAISCTAKLTVNGSEDFGDHDWDDTSACTCPFCDHSATVAAFTAVKAGAS